MPGDFGKLGAQPTNKPQRYVCLYSGRSYSGLVTNRSPLRSAGSAYEERYLGTRTDALIDGGNCEITPRLTLARRPGNPVYNSSTFGPVDFFYSFREFAPGSEQIRVMVDETTALYDGTANSRTLVFSKSTGAGQTYMQSVGNNLFFANGVDQKKWVETLITRTSSVSGLPNIGDSVTLNPALTPFLTTYFIDSNSDLQQLLSTKITSVSNVTYTAPTLTLTVGSTSGITDGNNYVLWNIGTATWLNGMTINVVTATGTTVTATLVNASHADYVSASDTGDFCQAIGGSPVTNSSVPSFSSTVPSSGNDFQGGFTEDGTAIWVNRGPTIENWGIVGPSVAPIVTVGTSASAWKTDTFYSLAGSVIDSNGNLQQVTAAGLSGSVAPTWSTSVGGTTTDGTVTWTLIQLAASLTWAAHTQYGPSPITAFSITSNVVTFTCHNSLVAGQTIVPSNLTTGTYLNGQYLEVLSSGLSSSQFKANFTHADVGSTSDSGTTTPSSYLVNNASGTNCLFQLASPAVPYLNGTVNAYYYHSGVNQESTNNGQFTLAYSGTPGSPNNWILNQNPAPGFPTFSGTADSLNWQKTAGMDTFIQTMNGAGEITSQTDTTLFSDWEVCIVGTIHIPVAGQYTFNMEHDDGAMIGFGGGAQRVSGTIINYSTFTQTAYAGYTLMAGNNNSGHFTTDPVTVNFPTAGDYPFEIDFTAWHHSLSGLLVVTCNNRPIVNLTSQSSESGTSSPLWPSWSTAFAPNYPNVTESAGQYVWNNIGPAVDFTWQAKTNFTLPNTSITDPNNNQENPYRTGVSGTMIPVFATGINQLTNDNPNLIWINKGPASAPAPGTISAFNGGYQYAIALANSMTDTVSNAGPLSISTGNFIGAAGITVTGGLPDVADIDPQSDFVVIFRTTDGQTTPFLISGTTNSIFTVPLSQYLQNGYVDTTPDTELNNLIQAPIGGENTPPALGAKNLAYHLESYLL